MVIKFGLWITAARRPEAALEKPEPGETAP
jgi:hypothetical protein